MPRRPGPEGQKSAVISVRLTPRMRFGLELMGRVHQETMPEVVARAINDAFTSEHGGLLVGADESTTLPFDLLQRTWSERESDRLANLALHYPSIMSRREKEIWQRIESTPRYWRRRGDRSTARSELNREALAEDWVALSGNARTEE